MALAKKCDRCGIFYDIYPKSGSTSFNSIKLVSTDSRGNERIGSIMMDLCPECMGKLKDYLNPKKEGR